MSLSHIVAQPVEHYPGIFRVGGSAPGTFDGVANGGNIESGIIRTDDFGETTATDFPDLIGEPIGVHSWILSWHVFVLAMIGVSSWAGSPEQWNRLTLRVFSGPGTGSSFVTHDRYILPLSTQAPGIAAAGSRRIEGRFAKVRIQNETGQSQQLAWDVWAKAA